MIVPVPDIPKNEFVLIGGLAALVAIIYMVQKNGGVPNLMGKGASNLAQLATESAGAVAVGAGRGFLNGVSTTIGIPTLDETITDAGACKIWLDANGYWSASAKCSAGAFASAVVM